MHIQASRSPGVSGTPRSAGHAAADVNMCRSRDAHPSKPLARSGTGLRRWWEERGGACIHPRPRFKRRWEHPNTWLWVCGGEQASTAWSNCSLTSAGRCLPTGTRQAQGPRRITNLPRYLDTHSHTHNSVWDPTRRRLTSVGRRLLRGTRQPLGTRPPGGVAQQARHTPPPRWDTRRDSQ